MLKKWEGIVKTERAITETFRKLYKNESLYSLSNLTGIQKTRLFRILNGANLKWQEGEALNKLIAQKTGSEFNNFFYKVLGKGIVQEVNGRNVSKRQEQKKVLSFKYQVTNEEI